MRTPVASLMLCVLASSAFGQVELDASRRLDAAHREADAKYRKARFGEPVKLTASDKRLLDETLPTLAKHQAAIVQRMLDGERPLELANGDFLHGPGSLHPGDFGPLDRVFRVVEIVDEQTAACEFADAPVPFYLRCDTGPLLAGRSETFGGQLVIVRKSDELPDLGRGQIVIELAPAGLRKLADVTHPPATAKRGTPQR
jgi:hypothetical protein